MASSTPVVVLVEIEWNKETIEQEIRRVFPEDPDVAVAIAKAESGLKATAYNPERHAGCAGSVGVMQIACGHHKNIKELENPKINLAVARRVYDDAKARTGNGWKPWGAYTNGSYKAYLK